MYLQEILLPSRIDLRRFFIIIKENVPQEK